MATGELTPVGVLAAQLLGPLVTRVLERFAERVFAYEAARA